jgi:hypothetical protein
MIRATVCMPDDEKRACDDLAVMRWEAVELIESDQFRRPKLLCPAHSCGGPPTPLEHAAHAFNAQ